MQETTDTKKFWKTIRPYFSDKEYNQTKITTAKKKSKIAASINNYFINITENLDLKP